MVINTPNINTTITSYLHWTHWAQKTTPCDVGNAGPGLGQAQNVVGLNWLMGSRPLLIMCSLTPMHIETSDKKTFTDLLPLKKITYSHKNEW